VAVGITRTQRVLLRGSLRCMVLFGPLVLVLQVAQFLESSPVSWTARVEGWSTRGQHLGTDDSIHVHQSALRIDLAHASTSVALSTLIPGVILALAVSLVGFLLLRIFHETDAGRPFFDTSASRLRAVSAVVAVAAILVPVTHAEADRRVLAAALPRLESAGLNWVQLATWLVVALVIRVVAEAFRIGTQLRDDTMGLV
jgi:hypothetical protein